MEDPTIMASKLRIDGLLAFVIILDLIIRYLKVAHVLTKLGTQAKFCDLNNELTLNIQLLYDIKVVLPH